MRRARIEFFAVAAMGLLMALAALPARGTQVKIFQARSQAAFLAGTLDGVSVDALGRMQLAPKVDRVASISEPFLLSAAVPLYLGGLLSDLGYGNTAEPQWANFAAWLIAGAMVFTGLGLL